MTYRDLPYYEGTRAKTHHEYKIHDTKILQTLYIPLHNFVLSGCTKRWLIHHSMACTAIYSSCDSEITKNGWIAEV